MKASLPPAHRGLNLGSLQEREQWFRHVTSSVEAGPEAVLRIFPLKTSCLFGLGNWFVALCTINTDTDKRVS